MLGFKTEEHYTAERIEHIHVVAMEWWKQNHFQWQVNENIEMI
jgi:hypothetical protein